MTLRTIGIVGTGAMGRGIAEVTAAHGFQTILVKATPGALPGARAQSLRRPALLLAGAGDEAGGGGDHAAHLSGGGRSRAAVRGRARQDAGDGERHAGLYRQSTVGAILVGRHGGAGGARGSGG